MGAWIRHLSLGTRTTGILLVVLILGSVLGLAVQRYVVFPSFLALEQEEAHADAMRCRRAIEREIHHLSAFVGDYGRWPDSWKYMEDRNSQFIQDNYALATFAENHVEAIWYVDLTGQVAWGQARDLDAEGQPVIDLPEMPAKTWPRDHPLLPKVSDQPLSGVFLTSRGPRIASTWPITRDGEGPPRGFIVMTRALDAEVVKTLVEQTRVDFEILLIGPTLPPKDREGLSHVGAGGLPWVRIHDEETLSVYTSMSDVLGRPALLVRADVPRRIAHHGRTALLYGVLSGLAIGVLLLVVTWMLFKRSVLGPVASLSATVREVANAPAGELTGRVQAPGSDELGRLADDFNRMLDGLEAARRALHEARDQAEAATRAKAAFLANMSHEIRTPMNGIMGMTDLLLQGSLDPEQREYCETVRSSSGSLLTILNDILDFSKIEAGQLALERIDFDLRVTLEETEQLLAEKAHGKGLELALEIGVGVPGRVRGDPGRLRQILVNLIGNAVKFTSKGEVLVRVTRDGAASTLDGEPVRLLFEVRDTGIGIPVTRRDRLFRSFSQVDASTTRRFGGTGLGLAITKQLVTLMGGEVGVESTEGSGSTFWFTVVLERPPVAAERAVERDDDVPAEVRGRRILIVDDNDTSRRLLEAQLRVWGCRPVGRAPEEEALDVLTRAAVEGDPFSLVLVDGGMPGAYGEGLARAIRSRTSFAGLRLVLLTSGAVGSASAAWAETGFDATVKKPVRQSALHDCLVSLLATAPPPTPERPRSRPEAPAVTARPAHILLAEDNAVNQLVARTMLQRMGHTVHTAANGRQAVEACAMGAFDLILMDCQMPEMDGYEATAEIRRLERDIRHTPIIAMTANAMQGDRERCLAAGMDDYVSKPVARDTLDATICRWLDATPLPVP